MPLPIAGAMTAAASLGRMAGAAAQTAMTAARSSRLAPALQQLASKLRAFDPAMLATLMQPAAKPDVAQPPPTARPPGGALAAALRDALPPRPTPPPPKQSVPAMPPPSPRPSIDGTPQTGGELTPLLARAWDHLETTLRGLTSAVVGGRAIGEEMLAIIGPRLHALNEELAPLLQAVARPPSAETTATPPAAAKPPATPPAPATAAKPEPAAIDNSAAAAEIKQALTEMGENNALDLVGAQPAPGGAQPAHPHAGPGAPDDHASVPGGAPAKVTMPAPQPGARS